MIEKIFSAVPPVQLTSAGNSRGLVTVSSTSGFKVKMTVTISDGSNSLMLEVKRVANGTQMFLGEKGDIKLRSDLSSFPIGSIVWALEQPRTSIPLQEIERAIYDEEPTVALRTIGVDEFGSPYSSSNPIPTSSNSFWDTIETTLPSPEVEIFTYKKDGDVVQTVTVTYESSEKKVPLSVVKVVV